MQSEKLIWAAIFLLTLFAVIYFQEQVGKNRVKKYLERKGFEDVEVQTRLFAGGRGTLSFDVEYVNKSGDIQKNACVVHTSLFSDSKIYWEKPLD